MYRVDERKMVTHFGVNVPFSFSFSFSYSFFIYESLNLIWNFELLKLWSLLLFYSKHLFQPTHEAIHTCHVQSGIKLKIEGQKWWCWEFKVQEQEQK